MARLGRFELPTSGSGDQRSIHLSYRRAVGTPSCCKSAQSARTTFNITILSRMLTLRQRTF